MNFSEIADIFSKLEGSSKRLDKIAILSSFLSSNLKEVPVVFDLIAGNYQREIDKRSIGISLKTIFSVISFLSQKSESIIEKEFNKVGDVGEVASKFLSGSKQSSLSAKKELELNDILKAFDTISNTSGTNRNKIKKEILANLFIYAKSDIEHKFLARLLIDDLRVGASEGVLREACVDALFPYVKGIRKDEMRKAIKIVKVESLEKALTYDRYKVHLDYENPRELYNFFLSSFEKKYNILNSFSEIIDELRKDLRNVLKTEIKLGRPLKSMLGVRTNAIDDAFKVVESPALIDFKYDGLRVQIHNDKGKVKLFSRNLDNITKQFPEVVEFVKLNFSNRSFVLDSECVGFDFDKMQFLPFQILSRRILTKDVGSVSHIKVVVKAFDILFLDGKSLLDETYEKRRELLEGLYVGKKLRQKMNFEAEKIVNLS